MQHNNSKDFTPPHQRSDSGIINYYEWLMSLSDSNPILMSTLIKVVGVASLALAVSAVAYGIADMSVPATAAAVTSVAAAGFYGVNRFGHGVFGLPDDSQAYQESEPFSYQTANGKMILEEGHLPRLQIEAEKNYDAGYVEGYILGDAIKNSLAYTDLLYKKLYVLGSIWQRLHLGDNFAAVLATIPEQYQEEMQGKVDGYNAWLEKYYPGAKKLTLEYYVFLQLLPDIKNFNPFGSSNDDVGASASGNANIGIFKIVSQYFSDLLQKFYGQVQNFISPACTTIALRVGDYVFFTRILDWPSNGAGKYFLQIDRQIGDAKRIIDTSVPVLTGALTVLNEDGLLIEMNISQGQKVLNPQGVPAVFFNRLCAEYESCVADIDEMLKTNKPLGPYHLTAFDAKTVKSYHFYQNPANLSDHTTETLSVATNAPQWLVVANQGMRMDQSKPVETDHRDSLARKQNVTALFEHALSKKQFDKFFVEKNQVLSEADILEIKKLCHKAARLALVQSCESVMEEMCVSHVERSIENGDTLEKGRLLEVKAITANLYVQKKELEDFKALTIPEKRWAKLI